ncbi:serine/threonine-protein kinase [Kutzneria sp. CA-103260]|uniref:serine/threonine-protein kinase n=1 Tax=Kutzneria sp. CA-103260 TaxID=2802641 RepID=UPI001BA55F49|nr:serine/threonine-protein kinase [Kutzneria sp. CA-103260]QUQ72530.1 Serine/threonine-protein kinase PknD [Kutzneria sp. CA-103260]
MSITGAALTGLSGERYTVGMQVFENHFGDAVYKGLLNGEQRVAVKAILNRKATYDTDSWYAEARQIEREWEVSEKLRTFKHEHLMLIDDRCPHPNPEYDITCYIMPWADKILKEILGTLNDSEVLDIVRQLATGLEELGAAGIVHRDIKPSNALLWDGRWRLADFGAASLSAAHQTFTFAGTGTNFYRAPEVLQGRNETPLSDIYSLGCLAYALRIGKPPFHTSSSGGRSETLTSMPTEIEGMDPLLGNLLRKMLAKNPTYRPQSAAEIVALCRRETRSPLAQRLIKLEATFTLRQAERDVARAMQAHRDELLARSMADLENLIDLTARSLQEHSPYVEFDQHEQSNAWAVNLLDHRMIVTITEDSKEVKDLICTAVIQFAANDDKSNDVALTAANLICTEDADHTVWSLVRFNANEAAIDRIGQIGISTGLHGNDLITAWNRRLESTPPAFLQTESLSSEGLIDLFLSHMEISASEPKSEGVGRTDTLPTAPPAILDGLRYEDHVREVLQDLFHHNVNKLAERGGIDFSVGTAMGTTNVEAKYLRSGKLTLRYLQRAAAAMRRLGAEHGLVVATNAFLTLEVREANQRGTIDGIAVEAVTWNGPADSPLLARAVARLAR